MNIRELIKILEGRAPDEFLRELSSILRSNNIDFKGVALSKVYLSSADLHKTDMFGCILISCMMINIDLQGSSLMKATIQRCTMTSAQLQGSDFTQATLSNVLLTLSDMNPINKRNTVMDGIVADKCNFNSAKMNNISLRSAVITNSQMKKIVMKEGDLNKIKFYKVILNKSTLIDCVMTMAIIKRVDFEGGSLAGTCMLGATITDLNINNVDMKGVDIRGATIHDSSFLKVDMRGVKLNEPSHVYNIKFEKCIFDFEILQYLDNRTCSFKDNIVHIDLDPKKFKFTVSNVVRLFTLKLGEIKEFIAAMGKTKFYKALGVLQDYIRDYNRRTNVKVSFFNRDLVCNDDVLNVIVPEHNLKYFKGPGIVAVDDGFSHPTEGVYDDMDTTTYRYFDICYRGKDPNNITYVKFLVYVLVQLINDFKLI